MNYLTNYYRNLCEQLQEKLNILEAQINEGRYNPDTGRVEIPKEFVPDLFRLSPEGRKLFQRKRTPEQQKEIDEWEAKYGIGSPNFGKLKPEGFKTPPRPYDPEYIEPPAIPHYRDQKPLKLSPPSSETNILPPSSGMNILLPPPSYPKPKDALKPKIVPDFKPKSGGSKISPSVNPYKPKLGEYRYKIPPKNVPDPGYLG